MKEENEYYQASRKKFITSDGKIFYSKEEAQLQEDKLNGKKKICDNCNGKGKINERMESVWINTSWIPTEGKYEFVSKSDPCPECNGKGYKELKWI